jgi:hypothetical protein
VKISRSSRVSSAASARRDLRTCFCSGRVSGRRFFFSLYRNSWPRTLRRKSLRGRVDIGENFAYNETSSGRWKRSNTREQIQRQENARGNQRVFHQEINEEGDANQQALGQDHNAPGPRLRIGSRTKNLDVAPRRPRAEQKDRERIKADDSQASEKTQEARGHQSVTQNRAAAANRPGRGRAETRAGHQQLMSSM